MPTSFKPIYLPYNEMAQTMVSELAADLGLTLKGKTGEKHTAILASFMASAQVVGVGGYLNWAGGTASQDITGFTFFPAAGATTIKAVRQALSDAGYITHCYDMPSGVLGMSIAQFDDFLGNRRVGVKLAIGTYGINDQTLLSDGRLRTAAFIDALRPYVLVNKPEEYIDKVTRKEEQRKAPKLPYRSVYKGPLGAEASKAQRPVQSMNGYWLQHPLTRSATKQRPARYFASATRVFHNGSLQSGGRWYGAWTQMRPKQRLKLQIDGEAVCEIDLNASQPTLFSTLLGIRMDVGSRWTDVYSAVVGRLHADEEPKLLRKMVKQVLVEMIGTGNSSRKQPAKYSRPCPKEKPPKFSTLDLFFDCEHSRGLYQQIQTKALEVFPALSRLDKKYYNGTGFLSYHESEILTQTLLRLKGLGVVAYGVHDCIIVKQSDRDTAVKAYRSVIYDYALAHQKRHKLPELKLEACVSIEQSDKEDVVLEGRYLA